MDKMVKAKRKIHFAGEKKMICHKCGKVVLWEKIICGNGKRIYHLMCWNKEEE